MNCALLRPLALAIVAISLGACVSPRPAAPPPAPAVGQIVPPAPDTRTLFVTNALSMVGHPYRYGGTGPDGFDCSGLVVFAAAQAGFTLPRTTSELLVAGAAIERTDIQAGDLVFLHLTRKELHVGIAIDHERFVHAPSTGHPVRIDALDAPTYQRGFLAARRVLPLSASMH